MRIKNPRRYENEVSETYSEMVQNTIPFVHSIETTKESRIYYFCPRKWMKFNIRVTFPIDSCSIPIIVSGADIHPETLIQAIEFVRLNEEQFIEAFYESQPPPKRLDDIIGEEQFLKLLGE